MNNLRNPVNWGAIGVATEFYQGRGYCYIEVPWTIPYEHSMITAPPQANGHAFRIEEDEYPRVKQLCLVASAEQSFVSLQLQNQLGLGKFVTCSPCFRNEPVYDDFHQGSFIKVELFQNVIEKDAETELFGMVDDAEDLFRSLSNNRNLVNIVKTDVGFDINVGDREVGSYGIRTFDGLCWIYGTGIAEPRFSEACYSPYE
jgi:seryl-tRNA synthetase